MDWASGSGFSTSPLARCCSSADNWASLAIFSRAKSMLSWPSCFERSGRQPRNGLARATPGRKYSRPSIGGSLLARSMSLPWPGRAHLFPTTYILCYTAKGSFIGRTCRVKGSRCLMMPLTGPVPALPTLLWLKRQRSGPPRRRPVV